MAGLSVGGGNNIRPQFQPRSPGVESTFETQSTKSFSPTHIADAGEGRLNLSPTLMKPTADFLVNFANAF